MTPEFMLITFVLFLAGAIADSIALDHHALSGCAAAT